MNIPVWLKPGIFGAIVGAVVVSVVDFSWGGWMTGAGAEELASDRSRDSVIEALVPVCLEIARTDPNRRAQMETIRSVSSFARRNAVMDAGWATIPGSEAPDRDLAEACADGLDLDAT